MPEIRALEVIGALSRATDLGTGPPGERAFARSPGLAVAARLGAAHAR